MLEEKDTLLFEKGTLLFLEKEKGTLIFPRWARVPRWARRGRPVGTGESRRTLCSCPCGRDRQFRRPSAPGLGLRV